MLGAGIRTGGRDRAVGSGIGGFEGILAWLTGAGCVLLFMSDYSAHIIGQEILTNHCVVTWDYMVTTERVKATSIVTSMK